MDSPLTFRIDLREWIFFIHFNLALAVLECLTAIIQGLAVNEVWIWVFEEVFILILIVSKADVLKLTHEVGKVVIGAMRVACIPNLAQILNFHLLWISIQLEN